MPMSVVARPARDASGAAGHRFLVVGMPGGTWAAIGAAVHGALAAAGRAGDAEPWTLAADGGNRLEQALRQPHQRVVVLVDHPERVLAGLPPDTPVPRFEEALAAWVEAARVLLRHVRGWPGRFLMVETDEALASQEGLAALVGSWLASPVVLAPVDTAPVGDALHRLVAREFAARDGAPALRLYEELRAACLEPGAATPPRTVNLAAEAIAQRAALQAPPPEPEPPAAATPESTSSVDETLLLSQIQQLEQELARQYDRANKLQRSIERAGLADPKPVRAEGMRMVRVREKAPHRQIEFELARVTHGRRAWPSISVRLVEHGGHPGLVILSTQRRAEALAAWRPDGDEKGRAYMLLVPADAGTRSRLAQLGSDDWNMVMGLAAILRHDMLGCKEKVAPHWQSVAARLQSELEDLPPRLRYDSLGVTRGPDECLEILLDHVQFGERPLGEVRLRWSPGAGRLHWLAPKPGHAVPVPGWPADDSGNLLPEMPLPFGALQPAADTRQRWAAASANTRALYLALLGPLSAAADQAVDAGASSLGRHELQAAVRRLHRQARIILFRLRLGGVVARMLRHLHLSRRPT